MQNMVGYTGAYRDAVTGGYLLGNGYRLYLPGVMRFAAPDAWSPFGRGGINPYVYCGDDPINRSDPSGHVFQMLDEFAAGIAHDAIEQGTMESSALAARNAQEATVGAEAGASGLVSSSRQTAGEPLAKRPRLDPDAAPLQHSGHQPGAATSLKSSTSLAATGEASGRISSLRARNSRRHMLSQWRLKRLGAKITAHTATELRGVGQEWRRLMGDADDFLDALPVQLAEARMVPARVDDVFDELDDLMNGGEDVAERLQRIQRLLPQEEQSGFRRRFHDSVTSLLAAGEDVTDLLDRQFRFQEN